MLMMPPCCCGPTGPGCDACQPCPIPQTDLTLSWVNPTLGNGSTTLVYTPGTPDKWVSACTGNIIFVLQCSSSSGHGQVCFTATHYSAGSCTGTPSLCTNCSLVSFQVLVLDTAYTCAPYHLHWTVPNNIFANHCNALNPLNYTDFAVDSPGTQCCLICTTATDCGGTINTGATVTIKQAGTTVAFNDTDAVGKICLPVVAGTYTVSVSKSGFTGSSLDVTVGSCPTETDITLIITSGTGSAWVITVLGCNGNPLSGATVVVAGGTYTTDGAGKVSFSATGTSHAYTVTYAPGGLMSGSGTITGTCTGGGTSSVTLSVATGYHCYASCAVPLPDTLSSTHSVFGSRSLAYDGAGSLGAGWYFTLPYAYPGYGCNCAASTVTVTGFLDATTGGYSEHWTSKP